MSAWWDTLDAIQRVLYCISIPATLILILQAIIAVAGGGHDVDTSDTSGLDLDAGGHSMDFHPGVDVGHGDVGHGDFDHGDFNHGNFDHGDVDLGHDGHVSDLPSLRLFTVQGFVALLCIFSWTAIVTYGTMPLGMSFALGAVLGIIAMYLVAKMMQLTVKLNQNGTVDFHNALGEQATVYLVIPAAGRGSGKINVKIQGSLRECSAISKKGEIKTGASVRIVDMEDDVFVVEEIL